MTGSTYNEEANNEKTLHYYSNQFQTIIQDIQDHKSMLKNNSITIQDNTINNNFKNLSVKMKNFYNLIENEAYLELDTYEKNYLMLYNIYANDISNYKGKNAKRPQDIQNMLNKRKAYYTSQELYKRNNNIYYFQALYFLVYLVFIVECLRSTIVGLVFKIILIIIFGLLPYLVYDSIIPWIYDIQINSDKYNIIKNVHMTT